MESWPTWLKAIAQVGFPIVIALWLIIRFDPALHNIEFSLREHREEANQNFDTLLHIQRLICQSVAKSPQVMIACLE